MKFNKSTVEQKDDFINKAKDLLAMKYPKVKGSYVKYGKDKSCDLDIFEEIYVKDNDEINNLLKNYSNKLKNNSKLFKLYILNFDCKDNRITKMMNSIGYLSGLLEPKDVNLNFDIDSSLPETIKKR